MKLYPNRAGLEQPKLFDLCVCVCLGIGLILNLIFLLGAGIIMACATALGGVSFDRDKGMPERCCK